MFKDNKGIVLIATYMVATLLAGLLGIYAVRTISENRLAERQRRSAEAFYIAEAGIQKALWVITRKPRLINETDNAWNARLMAEANKYSNIGNGSFNIGKIIGGDIVKNITSTGTASFAVRKIQVNARNSWLNKIPAALYSNGKVKVKFDKRDDAYIDGKDMPGVYSTEGVKAKKKEEERIEGSPPILEDQTVPEGLLDGIWNAFDFNSLREIAKANGTYFSADDTGDEYNNPYNKKDKYTLPIVRDDGTKITSGVFFFDARNGEPLDDDGVNPGNEIRLKLEGTTEKVSGVIVVVGDLSIKDTKEYDFLFDGVILVLDDLKIDDKRSHRRKDDTNDSDIVIRGAVLTDNVIHKGKKRKKKTSAHIKNATIEYSPRAIGSVSPYWGVVPGSWREK
jgi:hypothetical protein